MPNILFIDYVNNYTKQNIKVYPKNKVITNTWELCTNMLNGNWNVTLACKCNKKSISKGVDIEKIEN